MSPEELDDEIMPIPNGIQWWISAINNMPPSIPFINDVLIGSVRQDDSWVEMLQSASYTPQIGEYFKMWHTARSEFVDNYWNGSSWQTQVPTEGLQSWRSKVETALTGSSVRDVQIVGSSVKPSLIVSKRDPLTGENIDVEYPITIDGITRTVFIKSPELGNALPFNSSNPYHTAYDTGIELKDGANYEVVISMVNGTVSTSAVTGVNVVLPCILYETAGGMPQQTVIGTFTGANVGGLNVYSAFRFQHHQNGNTGSGGIGNVISPAGNQTGTVQTASSAYVGAHVDNTFNMATTALTISINLARFITNEKKPRLGLRAAATTEPTSANCQLLVKVTERTSGFEQTITV
jgi:hypothetical protein